MKALDYTELHEWMKELSGAGTRARAREMVHSILNQCRKLDIMNLDHGQLSNLRKHVVVAEDRPWILDFESAGTARKPRNVTTAAQYLFVGSKMSSLVRRTMGLTDTDRLINLLRAYKEDLSDMSYARILEWLGIATG
jgi:putative serine/threonine protein kinase